MYAIVDIRGKQFYVHEDDHLQVPHLADNVGDEVTFDQVLMVVDGEKIRVGTPLVEGASVVAEVEDHGKDKKVINFVKKRRKGFSRKKGHRQQFTAVHVKKLNV
ncbi:MAG: 50S ribosomal protein L21 [Candidatus Delongbacteria bacterium]|nr:50S ribosomal protein L21 [Candidatus Delongbacteria bacterium]